MTCKFKYWHVITAVNKNYSKAHNGIATGEVVTHPRIHRGPVRFTNVNHPQFGEYWAYSLLYLGKTPANLSEEDELKAVLALAGRCEDEPVIDEDGKVVDIK